MGDPHEPNNYRTIMIGHVFAKIYAIALDVLLSHRLKEEGHRARAKLVFSRTIRPQIIA